MAVVFRLATKDQASTYDFQTGNLRPQDMIRTPNGDGWFTTTMTLVARSTEANTLAASSYIEQFAMFTDRFWAGQHDSRSTWLEESASSETTKRSLIKSIEMTPLQEGWMSPLLTHVGMKYTLVIIHSASWEYTGNSTTATTRLSCTGGTQTLGAITAAIDSRIEQTKLNGFATNVGSIVTIWGGIRAHETTGTDTDFNPVVELELGTLSTSDVSLASDSDNASPLGTTDNLVSYATTSDDFKIVYETLDDAFSSTDYNHWYGDYQVLLRCKLSAANSTRLHLDWGYKYGTTFNKGPYVYISSTDYQLFEMGHVSIPPFPRSTDNDLGMYFEFQLYAMHMGSSATLTADCLILIPSTHYFKMTNLNVANDAGSDAAGFIFEDGSIACINYNASSVPSLSAQFNSVNWRYPCAGGILVVAGQESGIHYVDDDLNTTLYFFPGYRTHGQ